jgi:hypothetical protein
MRNTTRLALTATNLLAFLSAVACSSEGDGGGDSNVPSFMPGAAGSTTGVAGASSVPGAGGNTGSPVGIAGSGNEGVAGASFNAGLGGSAPAAGGAAGAPTVAPVEAPGGYFESGTWHGYAWTGTETPNTGTTITPTDFSTVAPGEPFCVSGTVAARADYGGVSLLGFNINQARLPAEGETEAPVLSATPTEAGIAVNFTKTAASRLRIQIQGPNGETDANDRWCYEIAEPGGRAFAPFQTSAATPVAFNTRCWLAPGTVDATDGQPGVAYANQPITSVVFTVPGDAVAATPYNYCIAGFAEGNSAADAPEGISTGGGLLSGTIEDKFGRRKVLGGDGKSYIVQNNAWNAASADGAQVLQFTGNSFQITRQSAGGVGDVPLGFPSIFVGRNGFRGANDSLTTASDDNLPKQISEINSIQTRFSHNATGDANATYDVWFAAQPPQGEYQTATGAFLMVWTYKPGNRNAIGGFGGGQAQQATVDGRQWNLFVGGRAEAGDPGAGNAQVISYVVPGAAIADYSFDLNLFIQDAVQRGLLNPSLFLTDVFAGFEIWSGGSGLRINEFTVDVQ